jgi:TfoX/Sxy family transcriptional regulator of competence genes
MPYSDDIDRRIGKIVIKWGSERKKMFGGTCYLINGNMVCGVYRDYLILRLGEKNAKEVIGKPHVRPMDITGRPMKGWVMVEREGFAGALLQKWLEQARDFAATLPPKVS